MNKNFSLLLLLALSFFEMKAQDNPLKIAIVGLTHTHVHGILGRPAGGDIEIVGIVEPNFELAKRYAGQHAFDLKIVYNTMDDLMKNCTPDAVTAFGSIYEHLEIVQYFAPKGIHVMVEKPLAVNMDHANQIKELAQKHEIHVLTNYETTWYPSNHRAYELYDHGTIGDLRKLIVRDGHRGPKKIGINSEFLDWLQDPVQNGGGAIVDFGCYGANLSTWIQQGKRPVSVTAVTQQLQPENNPKVDDEATIILTYDNSQTIIQASWNWPMGRKDMELYGLTGAIYADSGTKMRVRIAEGYDGFAEDTYNLEGRKTPFNDPFSYLKAIIDEEIDIEPNDLSALQNNMLVVEILDAARESAKTGKTVFLKK